MPKIDPAHRETEKRIEEIERKIRKEYSEAEHGVQLRLQEHWGAFQIKDEKKRELLKAGKISEEEYQHWRTGQIAVGKRWEDMRKTIAQDYMNANNIARKIADDSKADVFALNGNYAFYEIERRAGIDMSFSLYNHESVIRLIRDNPDVLPPLSRYGENNAVKRAIREGRIQAWEEGKIQSALTQGILQGMTTAQLTKHISEHVGALNESYARRYARTAITGAQNAGRYESFRRAKKLGVDLVVEWNAILDKRTRRTHRHMHGERHEVDEPFEIDGHEILYPGYPLALDELIWNCRCTLLSWVRGYEPETVKESPGMEGMTFEEWQNAKGAKEDKQDSISSVFGNTANGYTPEQQKQIHDILQNSNSASANVYRKYASQLQEPIHLTGDDTRAFYSNNTGRVSFNLGYVAKGDNISTPFQTHFHEYGHNIDYLSATTKCSSLDYRRSDGKTFEQIIYGEWDKKFLMSDADIAKKFFDRSTKGEYGMSPDSFLLGELVSWRRTNNIPRDSEQYTKLRDELDSIAGNKRKQKKFFVDHAEMFGSIPDYEKAKIGFQKKVFNEYVGDMMKNHSSLERADLSDMLERYSVEHGMHPYTLGAGHGAEYALKNGSLGKEAFAEMFSAEIANDKSLNLIKQELPEAYEAFKEILGGILK